MGFIRTSVPSPLDLSSSSESLLLSQPHVELFLSASRTLGRGTLHITTKRVLWLPDDAQPAGSGYSVDFPQLLMHALSRDTAYFPHPAIYCQLEQDEEGEGEDADEDDADGDDAEADDASAGEGGRDELTAAAEVRLVPDDEAALDTLYAKLSEGAELNPDEEREGEGDFFDAASLQCAPGVDIHSLLTGGALPAAAAVEHAGEEYEEDDEEDEEGDVGDAAVDEQLAVTGHAVHCTAGQEGTIGAVHSDAMEDDDVIVEHHEGEVIFKR